MSEEPTPRQAQAEIERLTRTIRSVNRRIAGYRKIGWGVSKADIVQIDRYTGRVDYLTTLL